MPYAVAVPAATGETVNMYWPINAAGKELYEDLGGDATTGIKVEDSYAGVANRKTDLVKAGLLVMLTVTAEQQINGKTVYRKRNVYVAIKKMITARSSTGGILGKSINFTTPGSTASTKLKITKVTVPRKKSNYVS